VVILHRSATNADPSLTRSLVRAREALVAHQQALFSRAGARVVVLAGRDASAPDAGSFGARLARIPDELGLRSSDGLVVLGSGAVPLLTLADARRLVETAASAAPVALTNNRYSSDIVAIGRVDILRDLPPLPSDNALPRWLEERAGARVEELPGRDRLAIDLDTPGDVALALRIRGLPPSVRRVAADDGLTLPRLDELRALARDPRRELLVAGRSGSRTLAWLERNVRCRVRFLAEERGLRAASELAIGPSPAAIAGRAPTAADPRPPRTTIGRLLADRGPDALGAIVAELADGAILDSRVLMADRLGADEDTWPPPEDRYASDLLRPDGIADPWLQALTASAASAPIPILLGAHTLVGPGIRHLLG
jgi:CTP:molybdopterin cytidylyltransferase MocA